eukprot:UN15324
MVNLDMRSEISKQKVDLDGSCSKNLISWADKCQKVNSEIQTMALFNPGCGGIGDHFLELYHYFVVLGYVHPVSYSRE